jgi:hypothetical protein
LIDTIFCVDIENYKPDLVLIDFSVNDYGHPKLMDVLIRKTLSLSSNPEVVLVNLWVTADCPITRYLHHAFYYNIPILNLCPAVNLCYGRKHLPKWRSDLYSVTDGVHPWGQHGVSFIGKIIFSWWTRTEKMLFADVKETIQDSLYQSSRNQMNIFINSQNEKLLDTDPIPLYFTKHATFPSKPFYREKAIGLCTRCDALVNDAHSFLTPVEKPTGFRIVTRTKIGYGGFNPNSTDTVKSFKRSWQSETPGSRIKFKFYGTTVKIAIWQRRDGMGILHAIVDGDRSNVAEASGFFKGYTWAMHKNNTGRSEIVPLFDGLEDRQHTLELVVSDRSSNPWVKGHLVQIFALLSASNDPNCKVLKLNS